MSARLQNTCGHGGTRLKHVLVCAFHELRPPIPLWQNLIVLFLLLVVMNFFRSFEIPLPPAPKKTLIDTSKLQVEVPRPLPQPIARSVKPALKPPVAQPRTLISQPEEAAPPEIPVRPAQKSPLPQAPAEPKKMVRRGTPSIAPAATPPAILRSSSGFVAAAPTEISPHLVRGRRAVDAPVGSSTGTRLRKETVLGEITPDKTTISRDQASSATRWHPLQLPTASERVAVERSKRAVGEVAADVPEARPVAVRSTLPVLPEPSKARSATSHHRIENPGGDGEAEAAIIMSRGVPLMSLQICDSSLQQEEAIKAVLSVVGSRQSCRNEKGAFQFKGTKRVSSFNLIIFPNRGREPSHRCEELEYAYSCLQKN